MRLMEALKTHEKWLPVVVVMPGAVIGIGDFKVTGRYVVNFLNRRLPSVFFAHTTMGFVYLKDIAEGHILAAKRGTVEQKHIL